MSRSVWIACLLVAFTSIRLAAQDADTKAARTAVESWLKLIDSQSYAASWDEAASGFRNVIPSDRWQTAVRAARTPFGPLKERTFTSASPTKNPPGAPPGDYIIFRFDTIFEKADSTETVTAVRDIDGAWRVAGYFVK